jgi:hypothetical protein
MYRFEDELGRRNCADAPLVASMLVAAMLSTPMLVASMLVAFVLKHSDVLTPVLRATSHNPRQTTPWTTRAGPRFFRKRLPLPLP